MKSFFELQTTSIVTNMSAPEERKAKKRKQKKGPVTKTPVLDEATCQNLTGTFSLPNAAEDSVLSPGLDSEVNELSNTTAFESSFVLFYGK